jgi:hypothetical protein
LLGFFKLCLVSFMVRAHLWIEASMMFLRCLLDYRRFNGWLVFSTTMHLYVGVVMGSNFTLWNLNWRTGSDYDQALFLFIFKLKLIKGSNKLWRNIWILIHYHPYLYEFNLFFQLLLTMLWLHFISNYFCQSTGRFIDAPPSPPQSKRPRKLKGSDW